MQVLVLVNGQWVPQEVPALIVPALIGDQQQFVALDPLFRWAASSGGGGGGGGGGVRSFNTRKGHVTSIFGDYGTDLIENDSANALYTGLTTATQMFDLLAERVDYERRAIAVTSGTSPVTLAALTAAMTNIAVTSDDDTNVLRVPAGLTALADGFRVVRIFNDPSAGSTNAISIDGAAAQEFNGVTAPLVVPLGGAVTLQLNANDSWHVVDFTAVGPGIASDGDSGAVNIPNGSAGLVLHTLPFTITRSGDVKLEYTGVVAPDSNGGGNCSLLYALYVDGVKVPSTERWISSGTFALGETSPYGVLADHGVVSLAAGAHTATVQVVNAAVGGGSGLQLNGERFFSAEWFR